MKPRVLSQLRSTLRFFAMFCMTCSLCVISGCATVDAPDERDPWESFNRTIFDFNTALDKAILRPVAEAYKETIPVFIQTGVSNFFSHLDDVLVIFNDLLQFKFEQAIQDLTRFVYNTFFGLFGLIDVATYMGVPKHHEDFGQTLATWGVGDGPYLVLPFLGPSTLRDSAGLVVDNELNLLNDIEDDEAFYAAFILKVIDVRARFLEATAIMEKSGIDPYVFVRDAYLQQRKNRIYDGNPPRQEIPTATEEEQLLEQELGNELEKALEKELEQDLEKDLDKDLEKDLGNQSQTTPANKSGP